MLGGGQDCYYWEEPITAIDCVDEERLVVGSLHGSLGLIHLKTGKCIRSQFDQLDHIISVSSLSPSLFLFQTKLGILGLAAYNHTFTLLSSLTLSASGFTPFPVRASLLGPRPSQPDFIVFTTDHTKPTPSENPAPGHSCDLLILEVRMFDSALTIAGLELADRHGVRIEGRQVAGMDWVVVRASAVQEGSTQLFYMNEMYRNSWLIQKYLCSNTASAQTGLLTAG